MWFVTNRLLLIFSIGDVDVVQIEKAKDNIVRSVTSSETGDLVIEYRLFGNSNRNESAPNPGSIQTSICGIWPIF